jgi:hypothetical protein
MTPATRKNVSKNGQAQLRDARAALPGAIAVPAPACQWGMPLLVLEVSFRDANSRAPAGSERGHSISPLPQAVTVAGAQVLFQESRPQG